MLPLLIVSALLIGIAVLLTAAWLSLRMVGPRVPLRSVIVVAGGVIAFQAVITVLSLAIDNSAIGLLLWLANLAGSLFIWHVLLNRQARAGFGKSLVSFLVAWLISSTALVVLAISLTGWALQTYEMHGTSMQPALKDGDRVLVVKLGMTIKPGDAIVHKSHVGDQQVLGRVKQLPGQEIAPERTYLGADGQYKTGRYMLGDQEYYIESDNQEAGIGRVVPADMIVGVVGPKL